VIDLELFSGVVLIVTQWLAVIASVVIGNIFDWLVLVDESGLLDNWLIFTGDLIFATSP